MGQRGAYSSQVAHFGNDGKFKFNGLCFKVKDYGLVTS